MTAAMSSVLAYCSDFVSAHPEVRNADTQVRGCWDISYALGLYDTSFSLTRQFVVIQTTGFGSCHFEPRIDHQDLGPLIGKSSTKLISYPKPYFIAGLDAAASSIVDNSFTPIQLFGTNAEKTSARAKAIFDVTKAACHGVRRLNRPVRVVMIGVLRNVLGLLTADPDIEVTGIDQNPQVVGVDHHGVVIVDGTEIANAISESDIVLASGMSLSMDGFDEILSAVTSSGAVLIMYMQTGANLARPILDCGAALVMSEEYPFYFMGPGESTIKVRVR